MSNRTINRKNYLPMITIGFSVTISNGVDPFGEERGDTKYFDYQLDDESYENMINLIDADGINLETLDLLSMRENDVVFTKLKEQIMSVAKTGEGYGTGDLKVQIASL